MHRTPSPTAAFWLAAFTYFIWGFTFLASRVAQNYGSPFVLLFWRFALAFVLMILYFHWMIPEKTPETYQPGIMKQSAVTEYSPSSSGASEDNGSGGN